MNPTTLSRIELSKKWEDCTLEEKIDKLRAEIREFRYTSQSVSNILNDIERLRDHSHSEGKVTIPFKKEYGLGANTLSRMSYID